MKGILTACLLAAALPAAAQPAKADRQTAQAKAHFKRGTALYKEARYRDAIREYEAAYALKPHPNIYFNIAQAYEKLGDIPNALRSYHQYLREKPDAEDKVTVQAAMHNLERRLAEKGLQQLLVWSEPPGASVAVDGKAVGKTPFSTELPIGSHTVQVSLAGYQTVAREVLMTADTSRELDVALQKGTGMAPAVPIVIAPEAKPAPKPPPPPPEAPPAVVATKTLTAQPDVVAPSALAPPPAPPPPEEHHRKWTWVALGTAGAALAGAIGFGLAANSARDNVVNASAPRDHTAVQNDANAANGRATAANVLYGVAGVAGATGAALFFVEGSF